MIDENVTSVGERPQLAADHSQLPAPSSSRKPALLREADLLERMFWSVPETAFLMRVSARTLWRMAADPRSTLPRPRRLRGRTLFARDEVLAYMAKEATR